MTRRVTGLKIRTELENMTTSDIYSLMLFAMYKATELPEYSSLSQLAYILDKDNLLKFCEYFGGLTIKVPTIAELEIFVHALMIYQEVDVEKKDFELCAQRFKTQEFPYTKIIDAYKNIKQLLRDYKFNSGR